jgi:predicted negative regulator of RcsB-dependent stress response
MITTLMEVVEKDIRSERVEAAIEKLKGAYKYQHWQLFLKKQLDSQIGSLLYAKKRFDEAYEYLQNTFAKNWPAMCMLASYHYRNKDYDKANAVMAKAVKSNKKEAFPYSLYAYMLVEQDQQAKAVEVLTKAESKLPLDERLRNELEAVRNNKKIKMQNYGAMWLQMHLGKVPEGGKQYQALLMNQKIKRR